MSKDTNIEWCDSTVNPTMGCDGCELWNGKKKSCYAGIMHSRYGGRSKGYAPTFEQVTQFPGRMAETLKWSDLTGKDRPEKPWLNGLPRTIFVSDMSDALSKSVPFEYLQQEIIETAKVSQHIYLWLTKRPSKMAHFAKWLSDSGVEWPRNLWPGTSATSQKTADSRIPELLKVPGQVHFVSAEPLFEAINFELWANSPRNHRLVGTPEFPAYSKIDWVILGGESGPESEPCHVEWIRDGVRQCKAAGVATFVKQLGGNSHGIPFPNLPGRNYKLKDPKGGDMTEWPEDLRVRQFPK